jgi:hypothetical protein
MGSRSQAQRHCEKAPHGPPARNTDRVPGKGLVLKRIQTGISGGWRRPVGWLASYALVLQLLVGALAGASLSAEAAGQNWSFFEICYGKGAPTGELPDGVPAKHTSKCAACTLASAGAPALAPSAAHLAIPAFVVRDITWQATNQTSSRTEFLFSQRQRAPPIAA